jgi:hypothetical protein
MFSSAPNHSKRILSFFKEPLLHFLFIGAALFIVYDVLDNDAPLPAGQAAMSTEEIVVTRDNIEHMNSLFAKTWQRLPNEEEQEGLVEDYIRSEIYYREAIAMGLDRDDEVLKRRLRQKIEFIYEDITSWAEPTDEDLRIFMEKHREKYLADPKVAFRQIYFNPDQRKTDGNFDLQQILVQLNAGDDPDSVGDTTLLESEIQLSPLWDIRKQFGDEFCKKLVELKPGEWSGPIVSGVGIHLVLVREYVSARPTDLIEIRETVKRDWLVEKQKELKDAAYVKIRDRYTVVIEKQKSMAATAAVQTDNTKRIQ